MAGLFRGRRICRLHMICRVRPEFRDYSLKIEAGGYRLLLLVGVISGSPRRGKTERSIIQRRPPLAIPPR